MNRLYYSIKCSYYFHALILPTLINCKLFRLQRVKNQFHMIFGALYFTVNNIFPVSQPGVLKNYTFCSQEKLYLFLTLEISVCAIVGFFG